MNRKKLILLTPALLLAALWPQAARADSLTITLSQMTETVVQGTTLVEFDATISAPAANSATDYINSDSSTTQSLALTVDTFDFLVNTPPFLAPGTSSGATPFELFTVTLPANLAPGTYGGTVFIQGGPDMSTFDTLGQADFAVTVTSGVVAPEPMTLLLLGSSLAGLGLLRKKTSLSR